MMKKIYLLSFTGLMAAGLAAQVRTSAFVGAPTNQTFKDVSAEFFAERAVGDTLLYIPLPEYIVNSVDSATFSLAFHDQDAYTVNVALQPPWTASGSPFLVLFQDPPSDATTPWDNMYHSDTSYVIGSTSWFTPAGQADDWFCFGPISIPASGATIGWRVLTPDGLYRDGYNVYVGATGIDPVNFSPSDIVYTKADNTGSLAEDTVWTYRQTDVPVAYSGGQAYFAFQSMGNDMFIIEFDEFVVKEANVNSVEQFEGFGLNQIMPNPAREFAYVNYSIGKTSDVTFLVTDINGKVVLTSNQGNKEFGIYNYPLNVTDFSAGVYFVTMKAGQFSTTQKLVVAK